MKKSNFAIRAPLLLALFYAEGCLAWGGLTQQQVLALPPYCQAQKYIAEDMNGKPPQQIYNDHQRWEKALGHTFEHFHHYCLALSFINQYYSDTHSTARGRQGYLEGALGNTDYVIKLAPANFVMLPELLTTRGKIYHLMGRHGEAMADLQKAIRLNPKFERAYLSAVDIYLKLGQQESAKSTLNIGLKYAPNSKPLLKRAKELGIDTGQRDSVK